MAPEQTPHSDGPSRAEVRRRIHSLYDQAETATGNYNATRAMTTGTRGRGGAARSGGRRSPDPTLDSVARQWFDAARSTLGPTVPALLPSDRMPDRPAVARPTSPAKRPGGDVSGRELEAAGRPVRELTSGPTAGAAAAPRAELIALLLAALPAAASERQPETPKALPAPAAAPTAAARTSPVRTSKEQSQRKLFAAREVLARGTARRGTPLAAIEARQAAWLPQSPTPSATEPMGMPGTGHPTTVAAPSAADAYAGGDGVPRTEAFTVAGSPVDTGSFTVAGSPVDTGSFTVTGSPVDTGSFTVTGSPVDTGSFTVTGSPVDTGSFAITGSLPGTASPTGTASLTGARAFTGTAPFAGSDPLAGTGGIPAPAYDTKAAKALAFARAQIGRPCVWGASGPESYDASGLTQAAWRAAGVSLPRAARDQAAAGTAVPLTALQPGDLVFFQDNADHAGHVGLCVGNGMMIHAPGPGAFIREEPVFHTGTPPVHGAVRPV
ncbi:C40 family peptidase [Streptomyces caeni]|uniref:C40 family peptidase n=1 Tax=Streptomyces caeni TaxID=2307231 RepID=A0ABW4IM17_9ACTN